MEKHFEMLGRTYTDVITGVTGIVDNLCFDLYGCVQASLREKKKKDGTLPEARWFDVTRLKLAEAAMRKHIEDPGDWIRNALATQAAGSPAHAPIVPAKKSKDDEEAAV